MNKASEIIKRLKREYGNPGTALKHRNAWELLVATVLSAQCTDERVNKVTPALFKKYPSVKSMAEANLSELEKLVKSTGFYKQKAKRLKAIAEKILKDYGGKVPDSMEELLKLPGVARKTANIVLSYGFGKAEGIAVDTHVRRVSYRLGLTDNTDPVKIEQDLMKIFPKKYWALVNSLLIEHGRRVCKARKPLCNECVLKDLCPRKGVE